ncbi:hypothetical protein [Escherichia coli]|uniref:hypothetical protein n=1 Tax=Escherichia coli TaxID=562 RepID=UPI00191D52EB|nr:hypothetical protein [Escherichia coli]
MKNALIVIDIQNDYFPGGSFPLEAPETACKGAVNAIEKAREEGWGCKPEPPKFPSTPLTPCHKGI